MSAPRMRSISPICGYVADARRFDMGERDHFISMEMAAIGMEMMARVGHCCRCRASRHADGADRGGLARLGVRAPDKRFRAPHILSLAFAGGMPAELIEALAQEGVYVAPRLGRMRVSPHVYNDEADSDRFVAALTKRLKM